MTCGPGPTRFASAEETIRASPCASHAAFIGSIPEYYDQYLGPLMFEEYGAEVARRVSVTPGGAVLETAAGTGIATHHLRNTLPTGYGWW
jgi:hypothetical protein